MPPKRIKNKRDAAPKSKRIQYDSELFSPITPDENKGLITISDKAGRTSLNIQCFIDGKTPDLDFEKLPEKEKNALRQTFRSITIGNKTLGMGGISVIIKKDADKNDVLYFQSKIEFKPPDGSVS